MLTREAATPANDQEKWTFGTGRVRGLVCTIAVSFGNYVHPLGGGHIIFAFSAVRRPTWFPDILGNLKFRICAKKPCEIERFRENFRPTGYLRNVIFAIFKKNFPSPKLAAILNFRIFAKNGKTQISFYLLNRAIYSDFVEIFDPQGI